MRVRKLSADGDVCFGHGFADYLENSAAAVVQNVKTRLALWQGQWFIDTSEGTPYLQQILGKREAVDLIIKRRILETPGVTQIAEFEATMDPNTRRLTIAARIITAYGPAELEGDFE